MATTIINGTSGNDTLWGYADDDIISTGAGNDEANAQGGNNELYGEAGNDSLTANAGHDLLDGGAGNDTLLSWGGNDTFIGGDGNDVIRINNNTATWQIVDAGADDDRIELTGARFEAADALKGGSGIDTLVINSAIFHQFTAASELNSFEKIDGSREASVAGTNLGDHIDFSSLQTVNGTFGVRIDGLDGDDNLTGTDMRDRIYGGEGQDYLSGGAGNDEMQGNGGHDYLEGGEGSDTLEGNNGNDTLYGDAGDDSLIGGTDDNKLFGGAGNDTIQGTAGVNYIDGGEDDDVIFSRGDGNLATGVGDIVYGGAGNDTFHVSGNLLFLSGGEGVDTAIFQTAYVRNLQLAQNGIEKAYFKNAVTGSKADDIIDVSGVELVDLDPNDGYAQVIDLRGGDGNDTLVGNTGNDSLYGQDGNDVLEGGAGNDLIEGGGPDWDTYVDVASYEHAAEGVTVDLRIQHTGQNTGGGGEDTLKGMEGVRGSEFADVLTGDAKGNLIQGGNGNDILRGGLGGDTIEGGAGDDLIYGGGRYTNVLGATPYNDKPLYPENLTVEALKGGEGADTYVFDSFTDWGAWWQYYTIEARPNPGEYGNVVTQHVYNMLGKTTPTQVEFNAAEGDRLMLGNAKFNGLRDYAGGEAGISYRFVGGTTEVSYTVTLLQSSGAGDFFQNLTTSIILSSRVDIRPITEGGQTYYVGLDIQEGATANDWLKGTQGRDSLYGRNGNDTLEGNGGDDSLDGGEGHDVLWGGVGNDTLNGGAGSDTLEGGDGNDQILGGARWDDLYGGKGDDTLDGGADNDRMWGGAGNDTYVVDHIGDRVYENFDEGIDTVRSSIDFALTPNVEALQLTGTANIGGTGNGLHNTINGNSGNNALVGGLGNDSLFGWDGNDALSGGNDHDRLSGGNGQDTLTGGHGNDLLGGGVGADDFVFSAAALNGSDHIVDFEHGLDRLVFNAADYGFVAAHLLEDTEFTVGASAVGSDAQFVWNAATQNLWFDADGAGGAAAIHLALIGNGATVTAEDLFFV